MTVNNESLSKDKWNCHWSPIWFTSGKQVDQNVFDVLALIADFPITLKDDKRSLVKRGELFGVEVVAKNPRDKNRRKWSRFLSLFRQSEAAKTLDTLTQFWEKSIPSVKPICVLEKRSQGFVVDSWLIYEFRSGEASDINKLPDIVLLLKGLHQLGYRHDDPNFGNFLVDDDERLFLIDCKGKARLGTFSDYYDYILLSERNEGVELEAMLAAAGLAEESLGYRLAQFYALYKQKRTKWKKRIRNQR